MKESHPEEFIGSEVIIIRSMNKSLENIKGKIIDETKNTFKILTKEKEEKIVLKKGTVFMIKNKQVNGDNILQRPEERIKEQKK